MYGCRSLIRSSKHVENSSSTEFRVSSHFYHLKFQGGISVNGFRSFGEAINKSLIFGILGIPGFLMTVISKANQNLPLTIEG